MTNIQQGYEHDGLGEGGGGFISIFFSLGKKSDYLMYSADLSITAIYYFHRGHMRHGNHRNHGFSMATACSSNNIYVPTYMKRVSHAAESQLMQGRYMYNIPLAYKIYTVYVEEIIMGGN